MIINIREITVILGVPRNRKLKPKQPERKKYFLILCTNNPSALSLAGYQIEKIGVQMREGIADMNTFIYLNNQLNKIGLKNIEKLKIASESGFYYTLLFCCRFDVKAKWLKMIKYYRDERCKNWTDSDVKKMWDVARGKVKPLDRF